MLHFEPLICQDYFTCGLLLYFFLLMFFFRENITEDSVNTLLIEPFLGMGSGDLQWHERRQLLLLVKAQDKLLEFRGRTNKYNISGEAGEAGQSWINNTREEKYEALCVRNGSVSSLEPAERGRNKPPAPASPLPDSTVHRSTAPLRKQQNTLNPAASPVSSRRI